MIYAQLSCHPEIHDHCSYPDRYTLSASNASGSTSTSLTFQAAIRYILLGNLDAGGDDSKSNIYDMISHDVSTKTDW